MCTQKITECTEVNVNIIRRHTFVFLNKNAALNDICAGLVGLFSYNDLSRF